jgi:hypothetical protein
LEVLRGVKFVGEIVGGVNHAEGVPLRDETLEGAFVEDIDETFVFDHLPEFAEECGAVVGADLLNAYALSGRFSRRTGLTDLDDATVGVGHNLHLLLAKLVTVEGESAAFGLQYLGEDGRIAEDVAIHEEEIAPVGIGTGEPEGEDIVVVGVIGVVDEMEGVRRQETGVWRQIVLCEEVADHGGSVACDDNELTNAGGNHGVDGTLEQCTLSNFEKTLRTFVREGPEALGHAGC